MLVTMLDGQDLSGLLDEKFSPAIWNLLWLLGAPGFWMLHNWYTQYLADRQVAEDQETALALSAREIARSQHKGLPPVPLGPERVAEIWRRYPGRWAIAGGWAIDLFLGCTTRPHEDIEVAVLRRDRELLWEYLIGWSPRLCTPGSLERIPWMQLAQLEPPVHKLRADPPQADVADLEIHLSAAEDDDWVFSRDPRVRMPLYQAIRRTPSGIPYVTPEIVLLYKSKALRPRDEQDFAAAAPRLDAAQREWLRAALAVAQPECSWALRLAEVHESNLVLN